MSDKPSVLFVCVHNAGRSQMAAAYLTHLAGDRVEVRSAGSAPANTVNPAVVTALLEEGIDISAEAPKVLTTEAIRLRHHHGLRRRLRIFPRQDLPRLGPRGSRWTRRRARTTHSR